MPANAKLTIKKAPQHFKKAFIDLMPNAINIIMRKNRNLIITLRRTGMFSTNIISEKIAPAADAIRNLLVLY